MSILIFVRVLENSSQRAYFRSCDENTATPLADKREIGRFYGFPCALLKDLTCMLIQAALQIQIEKYSRLEKTQKTSFLLTFQGQ